MKNDFIYIKSNGLNRIKVSDIVYVQANENYVIIHTISERFTVHGTMKMFEEALKLYGILRVQRSYLINPDYISVIKPPEDVCYLKSNGEKIKIRIGKAYKNQLLETINVID